MQKARLADIFNHPQPQVKRYAHGPGNGGQPVGDTDILCIMALNAALQNEEASCADTLPEALNPDPSSCSEPHCGGMFTGFLEIACSLDYFS